MERWEEWIEGGEDEARRLGGEEKEWSLGVEWYQLQESRYSLCRPRQGDARHHGEQRKMLQNVRATGVDLLGCWYRDSVISTCVQMRKACTHPRNYSTVHVLDSLHLPCHRHYCCLTLFSPPSAHRLLHSFLLSTTPTYTHHRYYLKTTLHPSNRPYTPPLRSTPHPSLSSSHTSRIGTTSDPT